MVEIAKKEIKKQHDSKLALMYPVGYFADLTDGDGDDDVIMTSLQI